MTAAREEQDFRWARFRRIKNWATLVAFIAVSIAITVAIVGLPVIRSAGYHELVAAYRAAQPREEIPPVTQVAPATWNFDVALEGGTVVRVEAQKFMDVVEVSYPDAPTPRPLYKYEDYSSPIGLRTAGHRLYVYWHETLFHTDLWILEFDLQNRRELARHRVDARDVEGDRP